MGLDTGIRNKDGYEEIYWRKANAIHKWFVDNIQDGDDDCGVYEVTIEQLEDLRDLCDRVIERKELAEELLPTQSGFFFGSIDYDEWYLETTLKTRSSLNELLSKCSGNETFIYWSSW